MTPLEDSDTNTCIEVQSSKGSSVIPHPLVLLLARAAFDDKEHENDRHRQPNVKTHNSSFIQGAPTGRRIRIDGPATTTLTSPENNLDKSRILDAVVEDKGAGDASGGLGVVDAVVEDNSEEGARDDKTDGRTT